MTLLEAFRVWRDANRYLRRIILTDTPSPTYYIGIILEGKGALRRAVRHRLTLLIVQVIVLLLTFWAATGWLFWTALALSLVAPLPVSVKLVGRIAFCASALRYSLDHANRGTDRIAESHQSALNIISRAESGESRFVLSLRSFGLDGVERRYNKGEGSEFVQTNLRESLNLQARYLKKEARERQQRRILALSDFDRSEDVLGHHIATLAPVVGIWNDATAPMTASRSEIPRLFLPWDGWKPTLRRAITLASRIVVHASELSPGVQYELEQILELGREADTVVVTSEPQPASDFISHVFADLDGPHRSSDPVHEPIQGADILGRFPHVVEYESLDLSSPRGIAAMTSLLRLDGL